MNDMPCDRCKEKATIHLTQVIDGKVKKVHLCESCAEQEGLDVHQTMSITDLLLAKGEPEPIQTVGAEESCPTCHMTRGDFKKTGRLGCPDCYDHFGEGLEPLLKAVQRSDQHTGKIPSRESVRVQKTAEIAALQQALSRAVSDEQYEQAAELRDKMRACERALETQPGDRATTET